MLLVVQRKSTHLGPKRHQTRRLGPKTSPIIPDSLVVIVVAAAVTVVAIVTAVVHVVVVVVVVVVVQQCVTFRDHYVTGN